MKLLKSLNPCCNGIYSMRLRKKLRNTLYSVLILVVMEYTQWVAKKNVKATDEGLNPCCNGIYSMSVLVFQLTNQCLNPCCNGIYSMSCFSSWLSLACCSLNPCCNGIYSMRVSSKTCFRNKFAVLILVVMEYTQWASPFQFCSKSALSVLILVVMEYTQWG